MQGFQDWLTAGAAATVVSPANASQLANIAARRAVFFRQRHRGVPYPEVPTGADHAGRTFVLCVGGQLAGAIRLNTARLGTEELLPAESPTWRIDAVAPFLADPGGGLRGEIGGLFVDADLVPPDRSVPLYAAEQRLRFAYALLGTGAAAPAQAPMAA